jgi:hypothetical protein
MYVFDHYVCFSSNVFGFVKKKALPFQVSGNAHSQAMQLPASIRLAAQGS